MAKQYHNPFSNIDLIYPTGQSDDYLLYCQTGKYKSIERSPFPRMVDLWFAGLSIAARKKLEPVDLSKRKTRHFNNGAIFSQNEDNWRIQIVMLIAIAVEDSVEIVNEPSRMMSIANRLAAAGVPYIVDMLRDGNDEPIWNLSEALREIIHGENT